MNNLETIIYFLIIIAFILVFLSAYFQLNSTAHFIQPQTQLVEKTEATLTSPIQANPHNLEDQPQSLEIIYLDTN